ncbi:MAG TPA: CBS domain-containing protein [Thermoplasmatales archaeon]|nr:CBS domain-containing protein [Thermoplasmatales archaeon]
MLVKEIMTNTVVTIDSNATVFEACQKYRSQKVGSLIVTEGKKPVGIITERDMIERIILADKDPKKTKVSEIMSPSLKTVHALASVEQAANIMKENKIKKLPVLFKNEIVGIVTVTDIANVMPQISRRIAMETLSSRYVNQLVKIKAIYGDRIRVFGKEEEDLHYIEDGEAAMKVKIPDTIDTSILSPGGEYYWTGVLRKGEIMGDEEIYIEVTDIAPA